MGYSSTASAAPYKTTLMLTLVALVLSATVAYFLFPYVRHLYIDTPVWTAQAEDDCDLHQAACRVAVPNGWVELSLAPNPIELLTPLTLTVTLEGYTPEQLHVDLSSPDMYMGFNRPELLPTGLPGEFQGVTALGVCVLETMMWEAKVLLPVAGGMGEVSFTFSTTRNF
ncbi:hypothetical protein ACFOSD_10490 [Salinispirillum marinum]|uniref:Uncharacterized protein n=2 Tax=Saccharospirillaceae TaxID=255527 RepID=A0ABV8BG48_9GAMM